MEETIKFETAKLAEEKGYKFEYIGDTLVSVPTQSALQKWLRETHNIHITINFYTHVEIQMPVWEFWISSLHNGFQGQTETIRKRLGALINDVKWLENLKKFNVFTSYEEALEAALLYALGLI
jgi:hypothetical protein